MDMHIARFDNSTIGEGYSRVGYQLGFFTTATPPMDGIQKAGILENLALTLRTPQMMM